MLSSLRQYGGTIAGGLAVGGAVGFGGSLLTDVLTDLQQQKQQRLSLPAPRVGTDDGIGLEPMSPEAKAAAAEAKEAAKRLAEARAAKRVEENRLLPEHLAKWRDKWASNATAWHAFTSGVVWLRTVDVVP